MNRIGSFLAPAVLVSVITAASIASAARLKATPSTVAASQAGVTANAAAATDYRQQGATWIGCGGLPAPGWEGATGSEHGSGYIGPHGEQFYFVTYQCTSPAGAAIALRRLLDGEPRGVASWPVVRVREISGGTMAYFAEPYAVIPGEDSKADTQCAYAWVVGAEVRVIYGPDEDAVLQLYEANPAKQW